MDERKERNVTVFLICVFISLRNAIFNISGIWEPNLRDVSPSNEEKCFVEEIHTSMHGENIMVKKSKPSVKVESIESVKEETIASGKEKEVEEGKGIDFFYILTGGGILIGILMVIFIIFRYVLHMI